jgi:hypothetical protein
MDVLYGVMAGFVGGGTTIRVPEGGKVLMNYAPNLPQTWMTAFRGRSQINFSSRAVEITVDRIAAGEILWASVHELGHNFGRYPEFDSEWTADFLAMFASIRTGIPLVDNHVRIQENNGRFESWAQNEYNWAQQKDYDWEGQSPNYNARFASILTCAVFGFVREDGGWNTISKVFASYYDDSYPYAEQRYQHSSRRIAGCHEFLDRIDYFGGVDFRRQYLDYSDWLEVLESEFRLQTVGVSIRISGERYDIGATGIDLRRGRITDVDVERLMHFPYLEELRLDGNQITDLAPLGRLTNLRELYLVSNQITDLTPLSTLTNLRRLDVSSNQITDVRPLRRMTNLTWLGLRNNQISDLSPLRNLVRLERLDLNGNPIRLVQVRELQEFLPASRMNHDAPDVHCEGCGEFDCVCSCHSCGERPCRRCNVCGGYGCTCALMGRILGNYEVKVGDAVEILKFVVELDSVIDNNPTAWSAALVTGGDKPTIADAVEILKYVVGLPSKLDFWRDI